MKMTEYKPVYYKNPPYKPDIQKWAPSRVAWFGAVGIGRHYFIKPYNLSHYEIQCSNCKSVTTMDRFQELMSKTGCKKCNKLTTYNWTHVYTDNPYYLEEERKEQNAFCCIV